VRTISPTSELPAITEAVTINGYSQQGAAPNTLATGTNAVIKIQLDGTGAGSSADGLDIRASNVAVRGLAINRFGNSGIALGSSSKAVSSVRIEGNFVGTDASGLQDRGNGRFGGLLIGGSINGVIATGGSNTIGGNSPFQRNLISGNDASGIVILSTDNNKVEGNLIGTAKDGVGPLGNVGEGVDVGSSDNFVGGFSPSEANTIAFNGGIGVEVRQSTLGGGDVSGNRVLSNSISSNGRLGIDLRGGIENAQGATRNDPRDPDTGANDLQNKPGLTFAVTSGGKTIVQGKLDSTPKRIFLVHFYSNPSGNEGKKLIGSKSVTTDANGNASFELVTSQTAAAGQNVTATATNVVDGNTSEFSAPRAVAAS
jgi:parallel beta-helix repeat protein